MPGSGSDLHRLGDFGGVVFHHLLDAFADNQALEADHVGAGGLQYLLDRLVGVQHVRLAVQGHFADDLVELAGDDLFQDVGRLGLFLVGHLGQFDLLFLGDELGRHVGRLVVRRVHGSHVHGQATGQLFVAAGDFDQHADAATVHVGGDVVAAFDARQATDLHVLAELGDGGGAGFLDGFAGGQLGALQGFCVGRVGGQGGLGNGVDELQDVLLLGAEVGLGGDFDQYRLAAVRGSGHAAFSGDAVGLLVGLGQARLAQPFGGSVDVAGVLGQGLLAFHHAGAGALAQFLDQGSSDFHGITSRIERGRPAMIAGRLLRVPVSHGRSRCAGAGGVGAAGAPTVGSGRGLVTLGGNLLGSSTTGRLGFFSRGGFGELFLTHGGGVRSGG